MRTILFALLLPAAAAAQQSVTVAASPGDVVPGPGVAGPRATVAVRADRAPVLDGRMTDAVWETAQVISGFRMFDPTEDGEPRFRTEARVAYDDRNLYVLVRAFDPRPDSIVGLLSRRDERTPSDWIKILVDSYHDRRTAYQFAVNPAGVKRDIYTFNDGEEDLSWDAVWDVATSIDAEGWVAEFRIPLSQLRYPSASEHTFGLMINRDIGRYNERLAWPVFRRSVGGIVSQFGEVSGIVGLASPRRLEVVPYSVASTRNAQVRGDYRMQSAGTVGADVKYGVTSNLTLDATVNPDFGQVEADPSLLNLSAFETFFPEKRPFFLEGQGLFRFDVNCNDGQCSGLFYSRRIGRSPQLGNDYHDASNPTNSTILGAAKLTGQLVNGISMGVLSAVTAREVAPGDRTIEPATTYAVARLQKDARQGASGIGFMTTAVRRNLDEWTTGFLRREAYAAGVDFRHQFWQRNYQVSGYYARSLVRGSAEAITRTQQSLVHNYQRPDDDLTVDPTRTSLSGHSGQVSLQKRGGGITRFSTGVQWLSPGFEINDVGYLSRANARNQWLWVGLQLREPKGIYRYAGANLNQWTSWTYDGLRTELGGNVNFHMQLKNHWWLYGGQGGNALAPSYCDNCSRGGPALRMSPAAWGWGGIEGDARKNVQPELWFNYGRGDEGRSWSYSIDPGVQVRASSRFSANLSLGFSRRFNDSQFRGNYGAAGHDTTHYTVASLDQRTFAVTTRLNFTATPTLSFQVFARPFTTAGAYDDWRQLAAPRAAAYSARFAAYSDAGEAVSDWNFNFKQYRSNAVMRWEYRPGSVLYAVWAQEYTDGRDPGSFDASRDFRNLFGTRPSNVFLLKGSYWLSW